MKLSYFVTFSTISVVLLPKWLTTALTLRRAAEICLPPYSTNFTYSYVGCYTDPAGSRVLQGIFLTPGAINSPEYCAGQCGAAGYFYAGLEYQR